MGCLHMGSRGCDARQRAWNSVVAQDLIDAAGPGVLEAPVPLPALDCFPHSEFLPVPCRERTPAAAGFENMHGSGTRRLLPRSDFGQLYAFDGGHRVAHDASGPGSASRSVASSPGRSCRTSQYIAREVMVRVSRSALTKWPRRQASLPSLAPRKTLTPSTRQFQGMAAAAHLPQSVVHRRDRRAPEQPGRSNPRIRAPARSRISGAGRGCPHSKPLRNTSLASTYGKQNEFSLVLCSSSHTTALRNLPVNG
jgi:hypothetical protein